MVQSFKRALVYLWPLRQFNRSLKEREGAVT